jgi:hypothetical protein
VGTVIEARVALPPLGSPPGALAGGSPAVAVVAWQVGGWDLRAVQQQRLELHAV